MKDTDPLIIQIEKVLKQLRIEQIPSLEYTLKVKKDKLEFKVKKRKP